MTITEDEKKILRKVISEQSRFRLGMSIEKVLEDYAKKSDEEIREIILNWKGKKLSDTNKKIEKLTTELNSLSIEVEKLEDNYIIKK
jgi:ElaB/YqjD/DUF883 family membrane-anchored ribosome-binding protein